jgi:dienelactone hydrolase
VGCSWGISPPSPFVDLVYLTLTHQILSYFNMLTQSLKFCWGGKFVSLLSGPGSLFKAAAQGHPGLLDAADAERITIPTCILPSSGESVEDMEKWEKGLKIEKFVKRFEQIHGWMSAKGNLEDPKCREDYETGYRIFLEWFSKHL